VRLAQGDDQGAALFWRQRRVAEDGDVERRLVFEVGEDGAGRHAGALGDRTDGGALETDVLEQDFG
jgi:hypothetical protein